MNKSTPIIRSKYFSTRLSRPPKLHFCCIPVLGWTLALGVWTLFGGCGPSGTPNVETVQAPEADPLAEARTILTNYANGMPVTSEAESFPDLVARVKAKDAAKGEILEKGLGEIKANPAAARGKAQELLRKI